MLRPSIARRYSIHSASVFQTRIRNNSLPCAGNVPAFTASSKLRNGIEHAARAVHERAGKLGVKIHVHAEQILQHQNLSIASRRPRRCRSSECAAPP